MKFQQSTSLIKPWQAKYLVILIVVFLFILAGCTKTDYPRPTREYYVNDFADILHPVTRDYILYEAENMYEYTKDFPDNGGTQIVFATFVVENEEDVFSYDLNALFNQWRIGKNDMGVLVPMFFTEEVEGEITYLTLEQAYIIPGIQLEGVLTPPVQESLLGLTLFGTFSDDFDVKVMYLLYELKAIIYDESYDLLYEWGATDLELFEQDKANYVPVSDDLMVSSMGWLIYLFSSHSSIWDKLISFGAVGLFFLFSGGFFLRRSGGGGRTGGFWIFRRR